MPRKMANEPFGKNGLPADYMFFQRNYYKTSPVIYPSNLPKPIDIWYERPLFGKIDVQERYVYPFAPNLKPLPNGLFAVDFMVDAYEDMVEFVTTAAASIRTSMTSIVDVTNPVRAYEDVDILYNEYWDNYIKPIFLNEYIRTRERQEKVKNFNDYVTYFIEFAKQNQTFPMTQTGFLASNRTTNRTSGLIIEFAEDSYGDDNVKWQQYLSNDFYPQYARIMNGYGFYIDRNVPWRIVSNMNSSITKNYMEVYGIENAEENFIQNFLLCDPFSYEVFKQYMWLSYMEFTDVRSQYEHIYITNSMKRNISASSFRTTVAKRPRRVEFVERTYEEFQNSAYGDAFMLEKYFQLRLIEEDVQFSNMDYKFAVRKIKRDLKQLNAYEAINTMAAILLTAKKQPKQKKQKKKLTFGNTSSKLTGTQTSPSTSPGGY